VKQRSFGFGRPSLAPSQVSVNLDPERTSIASQEDFAVCIDDVDNIIVILTSIM